MSTSPIKRPRQSLFLSDSDSDEERAPKRATPAPTSAKPDVDALFEEFDKEEEEDLSYKPLAPALDLEKLAKEAEQNARAKSKTWTTVSVKKDASANGEEKPKPDDGEKTGRKVLPKLDEERLVGPEGFPLLIEDIKGIQLKGKGHEHTDLNRLLQVYHFWTHKMYPRTAFKETVNRIEKLCHSKRMQVRLSVWRDEFKGVTKDKELEDHSDIIDLTEQTLAENEDEDTPVKSDQASSRPASLPPASSEADDDFDVDAVIRAEEERLAELRAMTASFAPTSPTLAATSAPNANGMDLDESNLWDAFDGSAVASENNPPANEDDMWDIVNQMEQGEHRLADKTRIPISGVNLIPSLDSTDTGRATNDDDWDEMYS